MGVNRNPLKGMRNWSRIRNYAMLRLFLWQSVVLDDRWPGTQRAVLYDVYPLTMRRHHLFLHSPFSLAANARAIRANHRKLDTQTERQIS
jgi:hypothetical protein